MDKKNNALIIAISLAMIITLTGCTKISTPDTETVDTDNKSTSTKTTIEEGTELEETAEVAVVAEVVEETEKLKEFDLKEAEVAVKEFEIESFTEIIDEKYFPQYSIKEITVKEGDLVRFKVNTTSGTHDLKIDELNVYSETPTGEVTVIEFTADKVGEFVYWCTKPRHRELGHWGPLKVIE